MCCKSKVALSLLCWLSPNLELKPLQKNVPGPKLFSENAPSFNLCLKSRITQWISTPGAPQPFSWKAPSRLLWSMADVLPLRLQRRSALRKAVWRRALQGRTDYIRAEKLWEGNKCPGLWSGLLLSYLTFRRPEGGEDFPVVFLKAAGFLGQCFWNLLCGLANRSSLLSRLVQKPLILPQEINEPAECVIPVGSLLYIVPADKATSIKMRFKELKHLLIVCNGN